MQKLVQLHIKSLEFQLFSTFNLWKSNARNLKHYTFALFLKILESLDTTSNMKTLPWRSFDKNFIPSNDGNVIR